MKLPDLFSAFLDLNKCKASENPDKGWTSVIAVFCVILMAQWNCYYKPAQVMINDEYTKSSFPLGFYSCNSYSTDCLKGAWQ